MTASTQGQVQRRDALVKSVTRVLIEQGPPLDATEASDLSKLMHRMFLEEIQEVGAGGGSSDDPAVPTGRPVTSAADTATSSPPIPAFGTPVSIGQAAVLQKAHGGTFYAIWGPSGAVGPWLGSWSRIIRSFPKLQGEKKGSAQLAVNHCITENPDVAVGNSMKVRIAL